MNRIICDIAPDSHFQTPAFKGNTLLVINFYMLHKITQQSSALKMEKLKYDERPEVGRACFNVPEDLNRTFFSMWQVLYV